MSLCVEFRYISFQEVIKEKKTRIENDVKD